MTPAVMDRFRKAVVAAAAGAASDLREHSSPDAVVLVEGVSDRAAVEALGRRQDRDIAGEGVCVVPMGGVTSVRRFLDVLDPEVRLLGLCDAGEERFVRRGLAAVGRGSPASVAELEDIGFFVCERDLEEELIRSLGTSEVERVLGSRRDLELFRTFQNQPAQRQRTVEEQLHRFAGTRSGRKAEYAVAFVDALDLDRVPRPLRLLLDRI